MTTTFLLFDIRTTVGPLEVYLQNLKSLRSLRNLPALEAEGFEAFEICRFSERCPKEYVFDVCEVCENQKSQKNVPKEYIKSCMGWPNECNIMQHRGKQKKCCIIQHLFSKKFDRHQTLYNKIQHDKTRYNKVAKRVQHFIKHQSCIMLYEMMYSFGRGLRTNTKNNNKLHVF